MPNHVTNVISFDGDCKTVQQMLEEIKDDAAGFGSIDFNKVIPMPPELQIEAGSRTNNGLKAYNDFISILGRGQSKPDFRNIPKEQEEAFLRHRAEIDRETWELGRAAFQNVQRFGASSWYPWRIAHWGTKWNAYDFSSGNGALTFHTAWSAPHPVLQHLS